MLDLAGIFLAKAEESLAGAESEFANGRYNNCANRSYYACFQAAVHALLVAGTRTRSPQGQWGHDFVQAEFVGQLVNRRKLYPATVRDVLARGLSLRHQADYGQGMIVEMQAARALRRAREFVDAVRAGSRRAR
jgi:uncharacterized protein (UPF0332 family)